MYVSGCSFYSVLGCLLLARLQEGRELVSFFVTLSLSKGAGQILNKILPRRGHLGLCEGFRGCSGQEEAPLPFKAASLSSSFTHSFILLMFTENLLCA